MDFEKKLLQFEEQQNYLEKELNVLKKKIEPLLPKQTEVEKRTEQLCLALGFKDFKLKRVRPEYYSWDLETRSKALNSNSIHKLCKSVILENTKTNVTDCSDPKNSKFYCVILQYSTRMMSHKIFKYVRSLKQDSVPKKYYHFNFANEEDSFRLSGYEYNAVTPFGMNVPVPILLSDRIAKLDYFWLGGGEVDLKLRVNVKEFISIMNPFIADFTQEGYDSNIKKVVPLERSELGESSEDDRELKSDSENLSKPSTNVNSDVYDICKLDLRVGKIISCRDAPDLVNLYIEQIDLGEEKPRQILSGLKNYIPIEQMIGSRVVVLANTKPVLFRGILSDGMVIAASNSDGSKVELVSPPSDCKIGEKISFSGFSGTPVPVLNPKKKIFQKLQPELKTDANGVANYKGVPFMTSTGPCKVKSLFNAELK